MKKVEGSLINDPINNLDGEMDHLSKDDLKERLLVAEKVMKSLFQRNKELEEKGCSEQKTQSSDNVLMCSNCQGQPVSDKKLK